MECNFKTINFIRALRSMSQQHPLKLTVELSKEEKIKQLNDKLNMMLKNKNVDHTKPKAKEEIKPQEVKNEKGASNDNKQEEEDQDKRKGDGKAQNSKKIKKEEKKQKVEKHTLRKAAGEVWQDKTMQDWPENDYRVFCGNLGNQVNDEILSSVFRRFSSFQMARVVRDRRTGKSRGYGFVSFKDANDFLRCLKEMNGKHVGNRPVKLMKSNWKERDLNSATNQYLPSDFKKNAQKTTHQICLDYKYASSL